MRHFDSITIGKILEHLHVYGLPNLQRSTLNRYEKKFGFAQEERQSNEWRKYSVEEMVRFEIAVLEFRKKEVPQELRTMLDEINQAQPTTQV